jgi:hypothetical protein
MAIGEPAQLLRTERHRLIHPVNDDKIIAQAMHFGELEFHWRSLRIKPEPVSTLNLFIIVNLLNVKIIWYSTGLSKLIIGGGQRERLSFYFRIRI